MGKKENKERKENFWNKMYGKGSSRLLMTLFLAIMVYVPTAFGQTGGGKKVPNTVISGVFKGALEPRIKLEVNQRFIDNSFELMETEMVNDSFRFEFYLDVPQTVTLKYLRNQADVYVEPGTTLHIDADANSFYFSFEFKGETAADNYFLREFCQKYRDHYPSTFKMLQYKKGIVWYKVHRDMDTHMRGKSPEEYTQFMKADKDGKMLMLQTYDVSKKQKLTADFQLYMWGEINYYWAYHMLTYGYAFGYFHNIDFQEFFGFMYEIPLQSEKMLGSSYYRQFLLGAINYYCEGPKKLPSPDDKIEEQLIKQFHYADKELKGTSKAFALTEIIKEGYKENVIMKMQKVYKAFLAENPHKEFNRKVQ